MSPEFSEIQTGRIGFLAGLGFSAEEIAADVMITATPAQISFYVDRLGLPALPKADEPRKFQVQLEQQMHAALSAAAVARNLTRVDLAERLLSQILGADLIGAILNEGV